VLQIPIAALWVHVRREPVYASPLIASQSPLGEPLESYNQKHDNPSSGRALLLVCAFAPTQPIVPCEIVVPVADSNHKVVTASAPDGHSYPVFQVAPPSKLVDEIRHTLETSFAQQALRLDRYARNLILAKRRDAHLTDDEEWLMSPCTS